MKSISWGLVGLIGWIFSAIIWTRCSFYVVPYLRLFTIVVAICLWIVVAIVVVAFYQMYMDYSRAKRN